MFELIGKAVSRTWPLLLVAWIAVAIAIGKVSPDFHSVTVDGEFAFLPEDVDSHKGEELFRKAFFEQKANLGTAEDEGDNKDIIGSSIVVIVRRESRKEGLIPEDKQFIDEILLPELEKIAGLTEVDEEGASTTSESHEGSSAKEDRIVRRIRTYKDPAIGYLLDSEDRQASLVLIELTTEFLEKRNHKTIKEIEELIGKNGRDGTLQKSGRVNPGLDLTISGLAVVGRDMRLAAAQSASATELWTVILVIGLLLIIYRAPLLALIPLMTVYVSTHIALHMLALLGQADIVQLFDGIETYVTVLLYGAGVDYCLFLIARYKEELDRGAAIDEGVFVAIWKVGHAVTASAGTVICGIGMMYFAEFGKFKQAGIAIALSLGIVLLAALTFTPALLRLTGRWAFWPKMRREKVGATAGWISPTSLFARIMEKDLFTAAWTKVSHGLVKRPGTIWLMSIALMMPFAVIGVVYYNYLSYGLLSELPDDSPSVVGTRAVQRHFPAGATGPVTVLLENESRDFTADSSKDVVRELSDRILARKNELGIVDVRSVAYPWGRTAAGKAKEKEFEELARQSGGLLSRENLRRKASIEKIKNYYVGRMPATADVSDVRPEPINNPDNTPGSSEQDPGVVLANGEQSADDFPPDDTSNFSEEDWANFEKEGKWSDAGEWPDDGLSESSGGKRSVTRIDVVFHDDPFSRNSIQQLNQLEDAVKTHMPEELKAGTTVHFIGATPSIRDLKRVTDSDQIRIDILVIGGVFLILVVLLRRAAISAYLIVSVFFSYLVTLGVTIAVFYALDPEGFAGLDWKVPMFLFTILIAVGEDYNIFLMTRIEEEQERHGKIKGVTIALERTGGIISSCGFIMAGTFSSLLAGTLVGMHQLGFALAFGVLLDTFVVRPILVPAYLILLHSGRFGTLGRLLGAGNASPEPLPKTASS